MPRRLKHVLSLNSNLDIPVGRTLVMVVGPDLATALGFKPDRLVVTRASAPHFVLQMVRQNERDLLSEPIPCEKFSVDLPASAKSPIDWPVLDVEHPIELAVMHVDESAPAGKLRRFSAAFVGEISPLATSLRKTLN